MPVRRVAVQVHSYNRPMISREPTLERLAQARRLLLEPASLDEPALQEALGCIGGHKVETGLQRRRTGRHGMTSKAARIAMSVPVNCP